MSVVSVCNPLFPSVLSVSCITANLSLSATSGALSVVDCAVATAAATAVVAVCGNGVIGFLRLNELLRGTAVLPATVAAGAVLYAPTDDVEVPSGLLISEDRLCKIYMRCVEK